jgi:hypothetical protein
LRRIEERPFEGPITKEEFENYTITFSDLRVWLESSILKTVISNHCSDQDTTYTLTLATVRLDQLYESGIEVEFIDCSTFEPVLLTKEQAYAAAKTSSNGEIYSLSFYDYYYYQLTDANMKTYILMVSY